jgi:hypothetical protein
VGRKDGTAREMAKDFPTEGRKDGNIGRKDGNTGTKKNRRRGGEP